MGKTTLAANLGVAISNLGRNVLIVDCNIATPHLSLHFGIDLDCCHTINEVLRKKVALKDSLYGFNENLKILPASMDLDYLRNLTIDSLKSMARKSFGEFDVVLLDSAPGMGKETIVPLFLSDEAIMVASPQIPDIIDVNRLAEAVGRSKMGTEIRGLVLNKVRNKPFELGSDEIQRLTGVKVIGSVPEDENVPRSINSKMPIVMSRPYGGAGKAFIETARKVVGLEDCHSRDESLVSRLKRMLFIN